MTSTRLLLASAGVGWLAFIVATVVSERWAWPLVSLQAVLLAGFAKNARAGSNSAD